jgi:hypothetical protein
MRTLSVFIVKVHYVVGAGELATELMLAEEESCAAN